MDERFILIPYEGLTEDEAFAIECLLIRIFGRIDLGNGCLRNLTDGGDGTSGFRPSDACRQKHREHRHSDEAKSRIGTANRKYWANLEHRRELSERKKRYWADPENRRKQSERLQHSTCDPEYRRELSERKKRYWADPENRSKQSERLKRVRGLPLNTLND